MSTWWISQSELNDEQLRVIGLPIDRHCLITGPPGSGKTNLLLLRAKYHILSGQHNVVVLTFTRTLKNFITLGGDQYGIAPNKIMTSMAFFEDLLTQHGRSFKRLEQFEQQREGILRAVRTLMAQQGLRKLYQAILLDEAHDYLPEEIETFSELCEVLFAVADARQQIFKAEGSLDALKAAAQEHVTLRYHYRNGTAICRVADAIAHGIKGYIPLLEGCHYDETTAKSSVECLKLPDISGQADAILERLHLQVESYPGQFLGVICPRNEELSAIWSRIAASNLADLAMLQKGMGQSEIHSSKPIVLTSVHGAKGLEFRTVHLAGVEGLRHFHYNRNMAYTAVTRAKTTLSVYYSDFIHAYLEEALAANEPAHRRPNVDDLFRIE